MLDKIKVILLAITYPATMQFINLLNTLNFSNKLSAFIGAIFGVIIFRVLEIIFCEYFLRWKKYRQLIDPKSGFEGTWMEVIKQLPNNPYTFILIEYNRESKKYTLYGKNYDKNGKQIRSFKSLDFDPKPNNDKIIYTYEALQDEEEKPDALGFCIMNFEPDSGNYVKGSGYFIDSEPTSIRHTFRFERIKDKIYHSEEQIKKFIESKSILKL